MLSRKECSQAINNWKDIRSEYSTIKKLINPTSSFNFSEEDCKWLKENNDNSEFHSYIGEYDGQLILIIIPLDKKGKEIELDFYLTSTLTPIENELTLVEVGVVTTVKKTTLSKNLEVINYCEETELPTYNKPVITEKVFVEDMEKWKNECLDWFYYECNQHGGRRIFRVFTVPFSNLTIENKKYNEVKALFGFKHSSIYQRPIPTLIFVATHTRSPHAEIIRLSPFTNGSETNTKDWSQPCPPMCRDSEKFNLIDEK